MSDEIKHISILEFSTAGYLQEVNRQFLHPLGLALERRGGWAPDEVEQWLSQWLGQHNMEMPAEDRESLLGILADFIVACGQDDWHLGRVWDYREDPEGIVYGDPQVPSEDWPDADKARQVLEQRVQKGSHREDTFGWPGGIQPVREAD